MEDAPSRPSGFIIIITFEYFPRTDTNGPERTPTDLEVAQVRTNT